MVAKCLPPAPHSAPADQPGPSEAETRLSAANTPMPDGPPDAPSPAAPTESPPTPRESRLAAQRRVLTKEFDLEIYIKRCEAQAIQEELEKGEKLLSRLKDVLLGW